MKNSMFVGLAVGMVAGACLACNCKSARRIVNEAQEQVKSKLCPKSQSQSGEQQQDGAEQNG